MNNPFDTDSGNLSSILPLTSAQAAIYVAHLLDASEISFNIGHYREITGEIDVGLLRKAFELVIERTPACRSVVEIINEEPFLKIKTSILSTN